MGRSRWGTNEIHHQPDESIMSQGVLPFKYEEEAGIPLISLNRGQQFFLPTMKRVAVSGSVRGSSFEMGLFLWLYRERLQRRGDPRIEMFVLPFALSERDSKSIHGGYIPILLRATWTNPIELA